MFQFPLSNLRHVLCLGAHADDIEIGCGGTLLKLQQLNPDLTVTWIVFSSTEERKHEAQESADLFLRGAKSEGSEVRIESFSDRYFPAQWQEIKDYFGALSQTEVGNRAPDLVFTHRLEDRHQDHRVISELTWNAFRDHLIMEYEIPKFEGDLGQPSVYVPLESEDVDRKIQLLMKCFPTQVSHPWFDEETFRAMLRLRGVEINSSSRYAEAFTVRKMQMG
jgi:LmbE family N-acetylglucosaminyl deacetylase